MAVNLATKYSAKVDERMVKESVASAAVNQEYEFSGVKTVKVFSVETAEMNDYRREGTNRYGVAGELGDEVQELPIEQDRSFTYTIDRGNNMEQMNVKAAGESLARQIREKVVPEIDKYRIACMVAGAGTTSAPTAITKGNAYSVFVDGTEVLDNAEVPETGRIAFVSASFYKMIKQDENFVKKGDLSQSMLIKGQVGEIDGVAIVKVPASRLPANTAFVITHPIAVCSPTRLMDYKIHDNPPGVNGWLVEGRIIYDAFVMNNKKNAIYAHITA